MISRLAYLSARIWRATERTDPFLPVLSFFSRSRIPKYLNVDSYFSLCRTLPSNFLISVNGFKKGRCQTSCSPTRFHPPFDGGPCLQKTGPKRIPFCGPNSITTFHTRSPCSVLLGFLFPSQLQPKGISSLGLLTHLGTTTQGPFC